MFAIDFLVMAGTISLGRILLNKTLAEFICKYSNRCRETKGISPDCVKKQSIAPLVDTLGVSFAIVYVYAFK